MTSSLPAIASPLRETVDDELLAIIRQRDRGMDTTGEAGPVPFTIHPCATSPRRLEDDR